jgi:hypothetical protein
MLKYLPWLIVMCVGCADPHCDTDETLEYGLCYGIDAGVPPVDAPAACLDLSALVPGLPVLCKPTAAP